MQHIDDRPYLIGLGLFIVLTTAFRLWFAAYIGLAPDEAYYWQWSKHLALSYPDHPPLVAWLIRGGTLVAGDTRVGVRLLFVLIAGIGGIPLYVLGKAVGLSAKRAAVGAMLALLLPIPAVGAIIATPDTPLALIWLISLMALARLADADAPRHWYILALALGCGVWTKHTAHLILILVVLYAIGSKPIRAGLRTVHPWIAGGVALALALPYYLADLGSKAPALAFQFSHLLGRLDGATTPFDLTAITGRLAGLIAGQIGLLTPLVAVAIVKAVVWAKKNVIWGLILPMLVTGMSALLTHPEQNWASLGHPVGAVIAIAWAGTLQSATGRAWRLGLFASVLAITTAIHVHARYPFIPLNARTDPVARLWAWQGMTHLAHLAEETDAVVCDTYGLAAQFAWHNRARSFSIASLDRPFNPTSNPPPGTWLLIDEEKSDGENDRLKARCTHIEQISRHHLKRSDNAVVRVLSIYRGTRCRL